MAVANPTDVAATHSELLNWTNSNGAKVFYGPTIDAYFSTNPNMTETQLQALKNSIADAHESTAGFATLTNILENPKTPIDLTGTDLDEFNKNEASKAEAAAVEKETQEAVTVAEDNGAAGLPVKATAEVKATESTRKPPKLPLPPKLIDPTAIIDGLKIGTPLSAVGHGEVIKMEYLLYIAKYTTNDGIIPLAHTTSYTEGISLSSISWGFYNTSSAGDATDSRISFTLHDIAGGLFANFMKILGATYFIYFIGPRSDGSLWDSAVPLIYKPITEECKIEFSQTQGFTYTFTGLPVIHMAKSKDFTATRDLTLTGSTVSKGATFEEYCALPQTEWNKSLEPLDRPGAEIKKLVISEGDKYKTRKVKVYTKAYGNEQERIEAYVVKSGTSIADAFINLFHTRFRVPKDNKEEMPFLEVNFKDWQGDGLILEMKILEGTVAKEVNVGETKVCIGSDLTCKGAKYRAELVGINLNSMAGLIMHNTTASAMESGDPYNMGNENSEVVVGKGAETLEEQEKLAASSREMSASRVMPEGGDKDTAWGAAYALLNKNKVAGFTIDIDMPYSFGFSPTILGGELKDAIDDSTTSVGIHFTQGADLAFWWYTDATCSVLAKQLVISNKYRITKVTHTVGLNGNSTQVSLSHLHLTQQ